MVIKFLTKSKPNQRENLIKPWNVRNLMEVISTFYDCIDKDVKILLDSKTSTQCHACGRVEKLRWYPYKKIGFSNVVKK